MLFKGELVVMLTESRIYSMHLQKRVNNGFKKKVLVYLLIVLSWSPAYNGEEKSTESRI